MATTTQSLTVPAREKAEQDCHCGCAPCDGSCCRLDCIVKPRFFCGQLLTDADLSALLKWARDRFGLSRYRHGWGVVCGLDVRCDPRVPTGLIVTPGYAVDCCGDDIVVCENASLDLKYACREKEDPCADLQRTYQRTLRGRGEFEGLVRTENRLRVVDIFIRYDEQPSEPSTAMGRGSCKQTLECEYSRTRESYKLSSEIGVVGNNPVTARAMKWDEGYVKCLEVLDKFQARFPQNLEAADVRRWLLRWIDDHPQYQLCYLRSKLCAQQDDFFTNQRNLVQVLFQMVQNCRNAYLKCGCFDCDEDARVPLARVWLMAEERASNDACRIITIDPYPPYRRPIQPECWPAPLGAVNVGRFIWHSWEEVCLAVDDLGLNVERYSYVFPNTIGLLKEQLRSNLFMDCNDRRYALVHRDEFLGERVIGFSETQPVQGPPQPETGDCPKLDLRQIGQNGSNEIILQTFLDPDPGVATFNWTVSSNVLIKEGQSTNAISVDTSKAQGQRVTVRVLVPSLPAHCQKEAEIFVDIPQVAPGPAPDPAKPQAKLIRRYPESPFDNAFELEKKEFLFPFAEVLRQEPDALGMIISYVPEGNVFTARDRLEQAATFLIKEAGIPRSRISLVNGGFSKEVSTELWIVPPGADPPKPTPGNVSGGGGKVTGGGGANRPNGVAVDDLTEIDMIGPPTAAKLREAGIKAFKDLASASVDDLKAIVPRSSEKVLQQWIEEAKRRAG